MGNYTPRAARRSEAKPLLGFYAVSGAGKTYSALMLARGFVGPQGRICMIETESGRGEAYADPTEYPEIGGYDVISMRGNFSPREYGDAIKAAEKGNYDALIIDSASHEWEGEGGVLDQAAQNQAAKKKALLVWQQPKIDHQRYFMLKFMQTPIPLVILCMRAKYPMEERKKPNGDKEFVRSEVLEPKQSEDILSEMFACGWIDLEHRFHPRKITGKSIGAVFTDGMKISGETGKQLKVWAEGRKVEGAKTSAGGVTLKAADGTGDMGEYGTISEWLDAFQAALKDAPTQAVALGLWDANSPNFYKAQSRAEQSNNEKVLERCKAIAALADEKMADPQQEDTHGGNND